MQKIFINDEDINLLEYVNQIEDGEVVFNLYKKLKPFYKRLIIYRLRLELILGSTAYDYSTFLRILNNKEVLNKNNVSDFSYYIFNSFFIYKSDYMLYSFIRYNICEKEDTQDILNLIDYKKIKEIILSSSFNKSEDIKQLNKIFYNKDTINKNTLKKKYRKNLIYIKAKNEAEIILNTFNQKFNLNLYDLLK